ncbi:MAG: c-type cytochrome [Sandaracinaceae bacterium]|nr:c-type cytochrome [Sandaracinaceae bacterium]
MRWGWIAFVLLLAAPARADEPSEVLEAHGCLACHTTDGTAGPGPTFAGLFERRDAEYVARSIREPGADVVEGYAPMPDLHVAEADVDALVEALRTLPAEEPPFESIVPLAVGTLGFLFMHLFLSFHPVRSRLVDKLGAGPFQGVYSLGVGLPFAAIFVGWMYRPYVPLWDLGAWARWVPLVGMPIAFYFLIAGYTTKNPATAGQQKHLGAGPVGVTTITRHPALWGFALWGLCHLPPNGDLASLLLFGSITALALLGMAHIDRRRARQLGEPWEAFVKQTSIVPFAAILGGRAKLDVTGQAWRLLAAGLAYGAMLGLHEWELGVSPFPY